MYSASYKNVYAQRDGFHVSVGPQFSSFPVTSLWINGFQRNSIFRIFAGVLETL
jgi:hypothetical protein